MAKMRFDINLLDSTLETNGGKEAHLAFIAVSGEILVRGEGRGQQEWERLRYKEKVSRSHKAMEAVRAKEVF